MGAGRVANPRNHLKPHLGFVPPMAVLAVESCTGLAGPLPCLICFLFLARLRLESQLPAILEPSTYAAYGRTALQPFLNSSLASPNFGPDSFLFFLLSHTWFPQRYNKLQHGAPQPLQRALSDDTPWPGHRGQPKKLNRQKGSRGAKYNDMRTRDNEPNPLQNTKKSRDAKKGLSARRGQIRMSSCFFFSMKRFTFTTTMT